MKKPTLIFGIFAALLLATSLSYASVTIVLYGRNQAVLPQGSYNIKPTNLPYLGQLNYNDTSGEGYCLPGFAMVWVPPLLARWVPNVYLPIQPYTSGSGSYFNYINKVNPKTNGIVTLSTNNGVIPNYCALYNPNANTIIPSTDPSINNNVAKIVRLTNDPYGNRIETPLYGGDCDITKPYTLIDGQTYSVRLDIKVTSQTTATCSVSITQP